MRNRSILVTFMTLFMCATLSSTTYSEASEDRVTLNDFYRTFELSEITPKNMQKWPYYRYTSMNWDEYGLFGTVHVSSGKGKAMAAALDTPLTYGSQAWFFPNEKMILTIGSYGQVGFSDLETGMSVVFMQDWEDNGVTEKLVETVARARFVIDRLQTK